MTKKGSPRRSRMNASQTSHTRGGSLDLRSPKNPKFADTKRLSISMTRFNPMQSSAITIATPVVGVVPVLETIDNLSGTQGDQDAADQDDPPAATDDNPPVATDDNPPAATEDNPPASATKDNPPAATEPEKKEPEEP